MMKKSKLSAHAASAAAAAGPFAPPGSAILLPDTPGKANSNGFKRGIYLAFVDNALQEKNKVSLSIFRHMHVPLLSPRFHFRADLSHTTSSSRNSKLKHPQPVQALPALQLPKMALPISSHSSML